MDSSISKPQLKSWLSTIPNGRQWLANQCGVSKSTVDGWCSNRTIPGPAEMIIRDLMSVQPSEGRIIVSLSPDEYALVESAAAAGRFATLDTFAHAACMEKALQLIQPNQPSEIPGYFREDPPDYGGKKTSA